MRASSIVLQIGLLLATPAAAQSFPARSGETGILDVPDAESLGPGGGQLATEFRFDHVPGLPNDIGPLPLYAAAGISNRLDLGVTMREWGQPGDARPARLVFGAAAKLQLWEPGRAPGVALSGAFDRLNERGVVGARLAASTPKRALRLAAFAGYEAETNRFENAGVTAGLAATIGVVSPLEVAMEALTGPRGENLGVAVRWAASRTLGISLGANYFPDTEGLRVALTLAMSPPPKPRVAAPAETRREARPEEPAVAATPRPAGDRPRFRLRVPVRGPERLADARHLQYGPHTPGSAGAAAQAKPDATVRAAAPSLEDLADAQLREQEALADVRERRVRATDEQLDEREKAAEAEQKRLAERERGLAEREQQLDGREKRLAAKGAPTQQQRQLESLEAQAAARERVLFAEERSLGPAIDAATGRERDASAREDAERREASRLAGSVSAASSRALQLEIRRQALGARNRQLAAREARLVAKGERIDALERQLRTRSERVDAMQRRLDARAERLDLLERRAAETRVATPRTEAKPEGAPAKDKAVFVMVVKSPTAIVKERAKAPAAGAVEPSLHPGVAVEKTVAAATIVNFPTASTQLSELDREAVDDIARLAAKERCELLIWARAKDPSLMGEAQRRAGELRTRVLASGPLDSGQVVTRITTRPGAQGVDVVVSALREAAAPAAKAKAPATRTPKLLAGESGKRQIREAVQAAQASIEACLGEVLTARNLKRAEGALKITVSKQGRATKVLAGEGDLGGTQLEECLDAAAKGWRFPPAEGEYAVDVPITIIRGDAK